MSEVKKGLAGAYAAMMQMDAWKDLARYADAECEASMIRQDSKPAVELIVQEVCEDRGIRKGMKKLIQHAEFCREGI